MKTTLRDYCDLISLQVDPHSRPDSTYVGLEHITSGELVRSGGGRGDSVQSSKFAFEKNDVLYGKLRPDLDKAILADCDGICTTELLVLRPKPDVDPRFLTCVMHSKRFVEHAMSGVTGAQHPRTSWHRISEFEVFRLMQDEQVAIAEIVWMIYEVRKTNDTALVTCQGLKQETMLQLFNRGLRSDKQTETEFGTVPQGWLNGALDDCSFVQTGAAKGRKIPDAKVIELPYLRVANVQDGHLDLSEMKRIRILESELDRFRLKTGDVVVTEGGDFDKLGRGFIWRGEIDPCVHQNHVFAIRPDTSTLLPEFLAYQIQSAYGKAYFLKVAHKTTNLACINSTKLKAFPVLLPEIDEQRDIVRILDAIDQKIGLHQQKKAVLEELFITLLHKLVTGEVRVSDLDLSALETAHAAEVTV
jgi:type I restriction enzyme S subunit